MRKHALDGVAGLAREHWPWLILIPAFVVGAALLGTGAGFAVAILCFPLAGGAYLIRSTRRRRRGVQPQSGGVLQRDASEVMTAIAIAELRTLKHYPALRLAAYAGAVGAIVYFWTALSRGWAIAATILAFGPGGLATVAAWYRLRRLRTRRQRKT